MKRRKVISESQLRRIVNESVREIMNEITYNTARDAFKASGEKLDKMSYKDPRYEKSLKQYNNLYSHFKDRAHENYDPDMPVIICTVDGVDRLTAGELENYYDIRGYDEPSQNSRYANQKTIGYPKLVGLIGPMWDGDKIRYEDQETYAALTV